MARISRRDRVTDRLQKTDNLEHFTAGAARLRTALYVRLSSEQETDDTIQNQVRYLNNFLYQQDDLELYEIYEDNGYSGTNFERPAFRRMMTDVHSGQVQCIVVKDFSRFGRNFLQTGYFLEILLPKLGVRFISINDRYDSIRKEDQESLAVPVKNMVNDLYARDMSKKICASNEARIKAGTYKIESSIYGYDMSEDQLSFLVNPQTAPVVQLIFHWFLNGVRQTEIAERLDDLGIMTPREYKYIYEFGKGHEQKQHWTVSAVKNVLGRDEYAGDRFLGKRRTRLYQNQPKQIFLPKEEWTVVENNHPALIRRCDIEHTREIMDQQRVAFHQSREKGRILNPDREKMFEHLVYCKKCGFQMNYECSRYPSGRIKAECSVYACRGHLGNETSKGCGRSITEGYLQALVSKEIRILAEIVISKRNLINKLKWKNNRENPLFLMQRRINGQTLELSKFDKKMIDLYDDFSAGVIDMDDYTRLKIQYKKEMQALKEKISADMDVLNRKKAAFSEIEKLDSILAFNSEGFLLTKELVQQLVKRIEVYDPEHVEIIFMCDDIFQELFGTDEEDA